MTTMILLYLLIVNALGFLLMLVDKRKAQKNLWRIPEATLFLMAAIGVPAILIAQIATAFLLMS